MRHYFRADGLRVDGRPVVVLKETNLPFFGATWSYYDGLVWHLSEEAMSERVRRSCRKPFSSRVFELKVAKIEFEAFYELRKERGALNQETQQCYEKLYKNGFRPCVDLMILNEGEVSHEFGKSA